MSACKSKVVVLAAFRSSPISFARLSVNVSAIRNSMRDQANSFRYQPAGFASDPTSRKNGDTPREFAAGLFPEQRGSLEEAFDIRRLLLQFASRVPGSVIRRSLPDSGRSLEFPEISRRALADRSQFRTFRNR